MAAKPENSGSKPSMKKVASRSSAADTMKTTERATREGMTLSLTTLTDVARQFLSFARAVAARVIMRYAAIAARTKSTSSVPLNPPRVCRVHLGIYRGCGIGGLFAVQAQLHTLLRSVVDSITDDYASVGIDVTKMLQ